MTRHLPSWLLLPHGLAVVLFLLSDGWQLQVGNNRSLPDLYLAIAGAVALALALVASLTLCVRLATRPEERRRWPWLLVHAGALLLGLLLAGSWIGSHLA